MYVGPRRIKSRTTKYWEAMRQRQAQEQPVFDGAELLGRQPRVASQQARDGRREQASATG